jgi:AcrR family transcriptional regulator
MARPRQVLLTRERIVETAAMLVDSEGLDAVSVRRLATELGVAGPSLYHHFATKDEILDAVVDDVVAGVDVSAFATQPWAEALRSWAQSYHAVLSSHPNIVPVLAQGPGRNPAALAMADAVYGALTGAGWSPRRATHIGALMRYLVTGSALGSFALGFPVDPELYQKYPHLHHAHQLAENRARVDEGAFVLGLETLLSGLESLLQNGAER